MESLGKCAQSAQVTVPLSLVSFMQHNILRFIHVDAHINGSFFFVAEQ